MSLVENIKALCKQNKMSIPKLEKELGFGHGSLYNWNTNAPGINRVKKVADYFNVSIEFLLYGIDKHEPFNKHSIIKLAQDNGVNIGQLITILDEVKSAILDKTTIEKLGV